MPVSQRPPSKAKRPGTMVLAVLGLFVAWRWTRPRGTGASPAELRGRGRAEKKADRRRVLTLESMNARLREMEYAVRGAVPQRAEEIVAEMRTAETSGEPNPFNFSDVLQCNIGNPHAVGQQPITFYRQVLSLVDSPSLLTAATRWRLWGVYPTDVIERAQELASAFPGGTGAYSHSQGAAPIRQHVCEFIEARDGDADCDPDNIFLLNGASAGIQSFLTALISSPQDAVLVPIPQYPIYSALIALLGGIQIGYYLDERKNWELSLDELKRAVEEARSREATPRALVLINPGNPTGQVLSAETLTEVIRFCKEEGLVLLADEVYQDNVYSPGRSFISARKVLRAMGPDFFDVELASFHSTSKGLIGECGRRGGYMELYGIDPEVHAQLYKLQSSQLCPNTGGQVVLDLMVHPPRPGDPSYLRFEQERTLIYRSLQRKSEKVTSRLNEIDGLSCAPAAGAMYVFAKVQLPERAVEEAAERGIAPDLLYCLSLLESTGIITVPGSGFGQRDGEHHFRMTFLPEQDRLLRALDSLEAHHVAFMAKYT